MVEPLEDYSSLLYLDERDPLHVREITPKDFYTAAALQDQNASLEPLLVQLILNPEVLESYTIRETREFVRWISRNEIHENIMDIDKWLDLALYLGRGKWDSSLDWLEAQPFSKIQVFLEASNSYNKKKNGKTK